MNPKLMRAGAHGFLLKDVNPENLVAGLRYVAAGDAFARARHHPPPHREVCTTEAAVATYPQQGAAQAIVVAYENGVVDIGQEGFEPSN